MTNEGTAIVRDGSESVSDQRARGRGMTWGLGNHESDSEREEDTVFFQIFTSLCPP